MLMTISYFIYDERNCFANFTHNLMFTIFFVLFVITTIFWGMPQRIPKLLSAAKKIAGEFSFLIFHLFAEEYCAHSMPKNEIMRANVNSERTTIFYDLFSTLAALIAFCFRSVKIYVCGERNEKKIQMNKTKIKNRISVIERQ